MVAEQARRRVEGLENASHGRDGFEILVFSSPETEKGTYRVLNNLQLGGRDVLIQCLCKPRLNALHASCPCRTEIGPFERATTKDLREQTESKTDEDYGMGNLNGRRVVWCSNRTHKVVLVRARCLVPTRSASDGTELGLRPPCRTNHRYCEGNHSFLRVT